MWVAARAIGRQSGTVRGMALPYPFTCPVAGVSFRQEVVAQIRPGEPLVAVAVDDNPHDAHAVEIRRGDGTMAGFLPRAIAQRARGTGVRAWDAVVEEVVGSETIGLRIKVLGPVPDQHGQAEPHNQAGAEQDDTAGRADQNGAAGTMVVRARSGRLLGLLTAADGDWVVVDHDGAERRYPLNVVDITAA